MDEMVEERFGDDVVGDDSVSHRPNGPWMLPGVRPIISRASSPTATMWFWSSTATTEGSCITMAVALHVDDDVGRAQVDTDLHACGYVLREPFDPGSEFQDFTSIFSSAAMYVVCAPNLVTPSAPGRQG